MNRLLMSVSALALVCAVGHAGAVVPVEPQLQTILELPADSPDLTKITKKNPAGANVNRNGFFSDIFYDAKKNVWYALSDRGPGGGLLSYATRVQKFTVSYDSNGAISGYTLLKTIRFVDALGQPFNGLNPRALNGDAAVLGNSFDPEGFAVGKNGHFFVADEYGPSIYEFGASGHFQRAFTVPANLMPREPDTDLNYVDGRPIITTGRQDNRGFEGLAINASRTKLYAIMQDPLVDEGSSTDGRRSTNLRIVEYDIATGLSQRQFVYQLDTIADINARNPSVTPFTATNQGRSIGASGIYAISDTQFLVLERDNRGRGVDNPTGVNPDPLHKRVYKIDISGATDVSGVSLTNTNTLPVGVTAVSKSLFLDFIPQLNTANHWLPEKIEGFAVGPELPGGKRLYLAGTDNDYSVTQTGADAQNDVCIQTDAGGNTVLNTAQVAIDAPCPAGYALIPALLMSFSGDAP